MRKFDFDNAMCKNPSLIVLFVCLLLGVPALAGYELNWYTVDGGVVKRAKLF